MKKIDIGQTITILANVGVILGIVFLGFEIQQNTGAIRGSTYQALSDSSTSQHVSVSTNPALAELLVRVYIGAAAEEFTTAENSQLYYYYNGLLQRLENSYIQRQEGLVGDIVFTSYGWNDGIFETQHFAHYWALFAGERNTSPEFREFFRQRVDLASTAD